MNPISEYYNEHMLEKREGVPHSQVFDIARDYDLRTNNEFITQLRS